MRDTKDRHFLRANFLVFHFYPQIIANVKVFVRAGCVFIDLLNLAEYQEVFSLKVKQKMMDSALNGVAASIGRVSINIDPVIYLINFTFPEELLR
jgi:hypothetical protein